MFYPKIQGAIRFFSDGAATWETRLEALLDEMEALIYSFASGSPSRGNDLYDSLSEAVPIRGENPRLGSDPFTLESLEPIIWEVL